MKKLQESLNDFTNELKEHTNLEEKAEKELALKMKSFLNDYLYVLQGTERPVERLFAINLVYMFKQSLLNSRYQVADVESQATIVLDDETEYRVDFFIHLSDPTLKNVFFVIECDGHGFHEKTKEQVRRDKRRERDLQMNGYYIIRFSGAEIYKAPLECALDAINIMTVFCNKYA